MGGAEDRPAQGGAHRVLRASLAGALALACVAACLFLRPAGSVDLVESSPSDVPATGKTGLKLGGSDAVQAAKGRVSRLHHELEGIEQKFSKQVPPTLSPPPKHYGCSGVEESSLLI